MTTSLKRKLIITSIAGIVVAASAGIWIKMRRSPDISAVSSSGGAALYLPVPDGGAYYLQGDPRWGSDKIGGSNEPMASVGCTICAVAMASEQLGYAITPKQLNDRLVENDGYTNRGWLIWGTVNQVTDGKIDVNVPSRMTHEDIDEALRAGHVPIVRYIMPSGYPHWVPIVGKSGTDYLVKDPLDKDRVIAKLADKADTITSVRYIEKD